VEWPEGDPEKAQYSRAGELVLFPGSRNALYRGTKLDLTAMECEILEQLLRCAGRAVVPG
jgi:DNA-binding response OmpR family regulator